MRLYLTSMECTDLSDSILEESADSLTQKAITFCILDPRPYAPPLESPEYRLIYLRRSSELKLGINPNLIESLILHGFKSLTLLSLISEKHLRILGRLLRLDSNTIEKLKDALERLNEAPLEPLYSYKKYLVMRRKNKKSFNRQKILMDYLHLDEPKKSKKCKPSPPPPPPPKVSPSSSPIKEDEEETTSCSSSSLFSYGSSNIPSGVYGYCPLFFCPRNKTPTEFPSLFRHIFDAHNPFRARVKNFHFSSRHYGSVELEFSLGEALRVRPESVVWFGPTEFLFDGIPFYEIVYRIPSSRKKGIKKLDDRENVLTNFYIFCLFAGADVKTTEAYSYVISLYKDKDHRNIPRRAVTSFEENPNAIYSRDESGRGTASTYFTFEESKLRNIAFGDGTLKYFVKIFKNRPSNNNSNYSHSSSLLQNNYYQAKRRHNH